MSLKDKKAAPETDPEAAATPEAEPTSPLGFSAAEEPKVAKVDQKPAKSKGGFCVYLGPSIRSEIQSGTIFSADKNTTIQELKSVLVRYPLVASLIVRGEELATSRLKVKIPGNLLYENYVKLANQLNSN